MFFRKGSYKKRIRSYINGGFQSDSNNSEDEALDVEDYDSDSAENFD